MRDGSLDAFFVIAGYPTTSVSDLVSEGIAKLIPIPGETALQLLSHHPFFSLTAIPKGTYKDMPSISTLAVGAQWIVSPAISDDLVYGITAALWNEHSRHLLDSGHPAARQIKLANALDGAAIPLHPGARRYYREAGLDVSKVPLPEASAQTAGSQ
jgi:TRAP transporter TAXI family solute receptor